MKKIILLFSLILFTTFASFSQNKPTYRESFKQLMILNGSENTFKAVISQMITSLKAQRPEVKEETWNQFNETFQKVGIEDLLDLLLPVYQKHLSQEDIINMIAFYQTPSGKKFAEKTPLITQESMQAGQIWGQKIGEDFAKKLKEQGN
ncbi:hypothetical protein TH53_13220 [Pedobacter lusitanus]|uniref:DUF2059 domain-containing protein n=1 Tax=Pedobacter lusitanus TaxID=1503925 RepID=A0A0D0F5B2_9SPHI|nr:DUF2059 domain-containing protein [Pedobacter lusitanus]KIO76773.1 hypothetical protein TH53_13220 [Pedobacter lusitanus]